MNRIFLFVGALTGFLGVGLGAFAAHTLKNRLEPDLFNAFEVGVRYQMYHALTLLITGWLTTQTSHPAIHWAGWCFITGTFLFSGSLYVLSFTGIRWWGAITPIGGLSFLTGWLLLAWGIWKG